MASITISIISLAISVVLAAIQVNKYLKEREICAELHEELDYTNDGIHMISIITLSTKGTSSIYYTDYRIIQIKGSQGRKAMRDPDDFPPDPHPGVIINSQPKIIKRHGMWDFPTKTEDGKPIKYEIDFMITGDKKNKIVPILMKKWSEMDYDEDDHVD